MIQNYDQILYNFENEITEFRRFTLSIKTFLELKKEELDAEISDLYSHLKKKKSKPADEDKEKIRRDFSEFMVYNALTIIRKNNKDFDKVFYKMGINYLYSIYEHHLFSILRYFYSQNPKKLQKASTLEEQKEAIDKKLIKFMYKKFDSQLNSIKVNLEIDMMELHKEITDSLKEFKATRDVIVHNNGIINDLYIDRIQNSKFKLGEERKLTIEYLEDCIDIVQRFLLEFILLLKAKK